MAFAFKFPDVGEGIHEGEIVKWLVKEGDIVKEDQSLVEMQTDKAVVEIPSPKSGKILKLNFKNGDTVKVGDVLVLIEETGVKEEKGKAVVGQLEEATSEKKNIEKISIRQNADENSVNSVDKLLATPRVRALANKLNVNINLVKGSGKDRIISEDDIINFKNGKIPSGQNINNQNKSGIKVTKKYDFYGYVDRVALSGVRKVIAENMARSYSKAVHVTHMDIIDATRLSEIREREKNKLEKENIKLTYLPFIIKAVISALKEHPYLNSSLEEETNEIILKKYYNIGVAVDTKEGLIVPVLKGADKKNIKEIAKELSELSNSARERKIDLGELKGGTFTITNIGSLGGTFATPIINYPESAILGLGRIQDSVLAKEGKIQIRKIMPFSLTFDHRILDGAEAAKFANKIKEILENPDSLLIEK
jgi:pyruvate dehydrogenase E2 component (dihydrolipoamide acetyltransferase)